MDFYKRVGIVCRAIPCGKAASYGQIALLCGCPRHARQVGYALKCGRAGEVPAYRVVNGQGYLSGAGAFDYPDLQRRLLEADGIVVSAENRVDLKKDGWHHTLADALDFRKQFEDAGI